jgi:hypothetical protein
MSRVAKTDSVWTPKSLCATKRLPEEEWIVAAEEAVDENPVNAVRRTVLPDLELKPLQIALLTGKWWGPERRQFTVGMFDNPKSQYRDQVMNAANLIGEHADIKFVYTADTQSANVRISWAREGYYSYLGKDNDRIPRNRNTMNLQGMDGPVSAAELVRVVPHEFIHFLGGPHEHSRQEIIDLLDREATIREYMATQGWTRQEVISQVFQVLSESSLTPYSTPADQESIMCYWFTGRCTKSKKPILGGSKFSPSDIGFFKKTWPKAGPVDPVDPVDPTTPQGVIVKADDGNSYIVSTTLKRVR